jgi:hypothetical protein
MKSHLLTDTDGAGGGAAGFLEGRASLHRTAYTANALYNPKCGFDHDLSFLGVAGLSIV